MPTHTVPLPTRQRLLLVLFDQTSSFTVIFSIFRHLARLSLTKYFLVACTQIYNPLCPTVCRSVGPSVTLCFFSAFERFGSYCSCKMAWLVYFFTTPAHPHTTCVTVWPCFLSLMTMICRCPYNYMSLHVYVFHVSLCPSVHTDIVDP